MLRQSCRLFLLRSSTAATSNGVSSAAAGVTKARHFATEVPSTAAEDSTFVDAWKKILPNLDPPKTPSAYMKPRPATPTSIPTKLTVNFALPYSSLLSSKEVDSVIIPATTGQMGVLPGHVATIAELKPGLLSVQDGTVQEKTTDGEILRRERSASLLALRYTNAAAKIPEFDPKTPTSFSASVLNMVFSAAQARSSVTSFSKRIFSLNQFAGHSVSYALACVDYAEETPPNVTGSSYSSDFAQLHRKMLELAKSGHARDALKVLNSMAFSNWRPSVSDYNGLLSYYLKSRNLALDELVCVYSSLRQSGLFPNALTYNILFNGFVFIDSLRDALLVVVEMHRNGYSPSFQCLSKLLKRLLKSGNLKDSLYVVDFMLLLDYSPSDFVLSMLISKLIDSGMLNEACRVSNMLLCKGSYFAPFVYNQILWALCKYDRCVVALSFLWSMKKRGFVHNICSYTALIYGFSKHGESDEVGRVLSEMDSFGCKPNVITYTVMAKHLYESGKIEEAFGILGKMEKDGCQPDIVIYNVILHALSHCNKMVGIDDMLSLLDQKGLSLDPYSYTALAGGMLKTGNVDCAYQLLVYVRSSGCETDVGVFNMYLHTLCLSNRSTEALFEVQKMREGALRPNNVSYNTVLKGLCLQGNLEAALELLDKFGHGSCWPDTVSVNTILSAACKLGDSSIIDRVLRKVMCWDIDLNVVSFTCLMKYFSSVGQITECYKLLQYMSYNGISPSTTTLNVIIHSVCKKQPLKVDQAQKILTRFRNVGVFPDTTTYNILLQAALRARVDALAHEYVLEMHRQGVKPDMVTYGILNKTLCKMGKISDAFEKLNMLLANGVSPGVTIYNNFLSAMLRRGKVGDVLLLLKHMASHGCEPNIASAEIIHRAISKGRMKCFPEAKELLEFARCGNDGHQQMQYYLKNNNRFVKGA